MPRSPSSLIGLNGRAALRSVVTGVERWSRELIPRLKALDPDRYVVLSPPPTLQGKARGQLWEQLVLPLQASHLGAGVIFSPANLAPRMWPRNVMVLHDVAPLRHPAGFSRSYRAWHRTFGVACARDAQRVLTDSEFSRRELIELARLAPERVVVVPGAVDARFHPGVDPEPVRARLSLCAPYVLTLATGGLLKNLESLPPLAATLHQHGIELVWGGAAHSHLASAGALEGIRRLGYVDEADLPGLYSGAEAFVLPSRYEGFGLTCLEAMACGTPVAAANRASLPETCGDGAVFFDPDDERAGSETVLTLLGDDALRAEMRARGLRRAAEFSWSRTAVETHAVLSELV